jgi:hypothetical protein
VARTAREFLADCLRTDSPMSICGRPRPHETRTAKAPLAGLRASLPAPGLGIDQGRGNGRSDSGPAIRDRPAWSCKQAFRSTGEGGKWRTRLGVHGSKTIPRGF